MELRPCLNCGCAAAAHVAVELGEYVTHDGARVTDLRLGPCRCGCCPEWDPDSLSRVTELLGLAVRRVIL